MRCILPPALLTLGIALLFGAQDAAASCFRQVQNQSQSIWGVKFHVTDGYMSAVHQSNQATQETTLKISDIEFTIAPQEVVTLFFKNDMTSDTTGRVTVTRGNYAADFDFEASHSCAYYTHSVDNTYPVDLNRGLNGHRSEGDLTFKGDDLTVYRRAYRKK